MASSRNILILILFLSQGVFAQTNRYIVFFKDKQGTSFALSRPTEFLSQRAIDRRTRQNISITEEDLPVTSSYVKSLSQLGAAVYFSSRWQNCVLVQTTTSVATSIEGLPFVARVERVAPGGRLLAGRTKQIRKRHESGIAPATVSQLAMLGIDVMHQDDVKGEGVWVAVFDSGFQGVNSAEPFLHLFQDQRLADTYDFIANSNNVFQYDDHGTEVFSVVGAKSTNYTGGAYEATFSLYVTEDVSSEYRIEEYNWLFAAERADSAGVEVIQSSLGYNTFDDEAMDYTRANLDGKTAVISLAAATALKKGMVVVVSAGNEATNSWQLVTPPADVEGVIAVGSVTPALVKSSFSSLGPTADGRIKPDVVALGSGTSVVRPSGTTGSTNGTSAAAPLITSLVAGLLQRFPALTVSDVYEALIATASQADRPDNQLGYGLPNYSRMAKDLQPFNPEEEISIYPNPTVDATVNVWIRTTGQPVTITVSEMLGRELQRQEVQSTWRNNPIVIDLKSLPADVYLIHVKTRDTTRIERIVKK